MWSLLSRRWQLTIAIGAGFVIAWAIDAVWVLVLGEHPGDLRLVALAVTIVGGAMAGLANFLWARVWRRFPALQARTFPDLNGTWEGELVSTWEDPATKKRKPPIPTSMTIRMGLFSVSVSLKTGESTSHSTRVLLEPFHDTRRFRVWYSYNNDPQAQFRHRSSPHEGVAFLELDYDADSNRLVGFYYTARRTTGDIDVRRAATPKRKKRA